MRRFSFLHVLYSLAVTLAFAGLFYLPYLSVRNKTINAFHDQQILILGKAIEGIQEYFLTYKKALEYLAEQQSIAGLEETGYALIKDFHAIHTSQLLAVLRTDQNGRILWNTAEQTIDDKVLVGERIFSAFFPAEQPGVSSVFSYNTRLVALLTQPIFDREQFLGNISFLLPCDRIAKQHIESIKIDLSTYIMLFSRSGKTLYAKDTASIGKDVSSYHNEELLQLHKKMKEHGSGIFSLEKDFIQTPVDPGISRYGVYLPIDLPGNRYWSILIVSPENEVLGAMAVFRRQWMLVTVIASLVVGVLSIGWGITAVRRKEERQKRRFEKQLVQLLDHAPVGVLMVSDNGLISYANNSVATMVGADRARKVFHKQFVDLVPPEERKQVEERIKNPVNTDPEDLMSSRIVRSDDKKLDVLLSVTPLQLGTGQHRIVIVQDVTEKRRGEEAQQRLTTAVEQVREIVLTTDTQGRIDYVNNTFCSVTGYTREEIDGRSARILWSRENEKRLFHHIYAVVRSNLIWQGKVTIRKKNGADFLAATSITPVKNRKGQVTHFVTVQRDITKEVELESRVRQAQKMEAIGTLAGGIAHDFNNILGAIIGFTDMSLLQTAKDSAVYENLQHIRKGGKRAADLVQQILTFSRQSSLEKSPVTVAPLIKESLHFIRASLPATIEIDVRIADEESKVIAAPVQLQQIVMNLCTNAFYAMRETGGTLFVVLERLSEKECRELPGSLEGKYLRLLVKDTGAGMDDATLERIFTPFFTTREPGEGTGMGLSVVHGIVQDLGGYIRVHSGINEGTMFTVLLPLADNGSEESCLDSEPLLSQGNEHILVVDDEKEIRQTSKMMLDHFGYKVSTAATPLEALSLIKDPEQHVDLVLTDQTMPEMTGIELIREIIKVKSDMPIILCTGYSDKVNLDIAIAAGARDLMMKPVDLQELSSCIRAALGGEIGYHQG